MNKILIFIALIVGFQDSRYHKYCNQKEYIRVHEFHDTDIVCTAYQVADSYKYDNGFGTTLIYESDGSVSLEENTVLGKSKWNSKTFKIEYEHEMPSISPPQNNEPIPQLDLEY